MSNWFQDPSSPEANIVSSSQKKKKKKKALEAAAAPVEASEQPKKKKNKKKQKKKSVADETDQPKPKKRRKVDVEAEYLMSNERLKAYGLNPKKLKKKLFNQKMKQAEWNDPEFAKK